MKKEGPMKCFKRKNDFDPKKETYICERIIWLVTRGDVTGFVGRDRNCHRLCHDELGSKNSPESSTNHFVHCYTQIKRGNEILEGEPFPDLIMYWIALPDSSGSVETGGVAWVETVGSEAKSVESDKEPGDIGGQEGPLRNSAGKPTPIFLHENDRRP
jgi:hypothetical protein